jgi:hypothetical protein
LWAKDKNEGNYEEALEKMFSWEVNRRWGKKDDIRAFKVFKLMIEEAGFTVEIFMKKVCTLRLSNS